MDKLTIRDVDVADKRVFVRVDFNVPLADGKVTDDSRIRAAIPTITALLGAGARVILASHLGRPDGKVQDSLRLRPVRQRLTQLLRRNVPVTGDALGIGTEDAIKRLRPGEVLLLENLRFHAEEERNATGPPPRRRRTIRPSPPPSPRTPTSSSTTRSGPRIAPTPPRSASRSSCRPT